MIRWRKVRAVTRFELASTVKRPGYLIATFGMPVFLLLYGVLVSIPALLMAKKINEVKVYGLVDRGSVLTLHKEAAALPLEVPPELEAVLEMAGQRPGLDQAVSGRLSARFRPYPDLEAARAALSAGAITAYYLLEEDFLATGRADVYFAADAAPKTKGARSSLEALVRERLLAGAVPPAVVARVRQPIVASDAWTVEPGGEVARRSAVQRIVRVAVPLVFAVMLFISVMMSAGFLIQGTAVEKENKVVEVLLAAADPDEILLGKLLGLGGAGLLQIGVWFSMVAVVGLLFASAIAAAGVAVPWLAVLASPPYFAAAYFFLGSLILGTGSLGKNLKEIQQASMVWSLLSAVPMFFIAPLISEPNGTIGQVLTWIPFATPLTMVLRLSLEPAGVAWWEIAGSFALMLLATWLAIRLGARLFRVGLLLSGARPKLREIWRQARLSAR